MVKLRILHTNDVYTLNQFPAYKTFLQDYFLPGSTIQTNGGDVLSPYL